MRDGVLTLGPRKNLHEAMSGRSSYNQLFQRASNWLQQCLSDHAACQNTPRHDSSERRLLHRLPKRLIDLMQQESVVIINCADWVSQNLVSADELAEYCTLSYRWGLTTQDHVLTATFTMLLGMPFNSMPQTFKDAFVVARGLGIRFLWIDALCIVQPTEDDNKDWLEEGYRMGLIYENAVCTIAATCAFSVHQGFLSQTSTTTIAVRSWTAGEMATIDGASSSTGPVEKRPMIPDFFQCVSESPLNERGWVMQERALSKRVIHFTKGGLFWECGTLKAHDKYGVLDKEKDFGACRHKEAMLSVARARRTRHLCPVEWFHFIKQYSYAKFTKPQDRLVALSSVARAIESILRSEYLAGLWRNDLVRGLQWHCFTPEPKPRTVTVPTWSWASVTSGIEFTALCINTLPTKLIEVVDVQVQPAPGSHSYGNISQGRLTVKGTLTSLGLPIIKPPTFDHSLWVHWDEVQEDDKKGPPADVMLARLFYRRYTLLPTGVGRRQISIKNAEVGALVLEPVGDTRVNGRGVVESINGVYRRIGWVKYDIWMMDVDVDKLEFDLRPFGREWMELDPGEITII
jgi:hypothetical protein